MSIALREINRDLVAEGKKPLAALPPLAYADGRTKQSFRDDTDINKMLAKAQRAGSIAHLQKHGAYYGDFSEIDNLLDAHLMYERGVEIFEDLPSELRREFGNSPTEFFNYVNNPENADKLAEKLPMLAEPGAQLVAPIRTAITEAVREGQAAASRPGTSPSGDVEPEASPASSADSGADTSSST